MSDQRMLKTVVGRMFGRAVALAALATVGTSIAACRDAIPAPPEAAPTLPPAAVIEGAAPATVATIAPPEPPAGMFSFPEDGAVSPAAAATMVAAGWGGRLLAASSGEGMHNTLTAVDLDAGRIDALWSTGEQANISDWTPAPTGGRIAYRSIERQGSAVEALESIVVQDLAAGAAPLTLAAIDTKQARVAGFVWAPGGDAIFYGLLAGRMADVAGTDPKPAETFEIRRVGVPTADAPAADTPAADDRVIHQTPLEADAPVDLALVGYDIATRRAAVSETARDSGLVAALRIVAPEGGETRRVELDPAEVTTAASADGRWLAIVGAGADGTWRVRVLSLADGTLAIPSGRVDDANAVSPPVWSPDSDEVAWTELVEPAPVDAARLDAWDGPLARTVLRIAPVGAEGRAAAAVEIVGEAGPIGFSPDGEAILLGVDAPSSISASGSGTLEVFAMASGKPTTLLPWRPTADTWWLGWVR